MAESKYGMIVGYDGSECGDRALDWALEEAKLRGTALTIFHSWHYPYTGMMGPVISEIESAGKQTLMTAVQRAKAQAPDVTVKPLLAYGSPGLTLVEHSRNADLVIVGSHGHSGFQELMLGSVSNQVSLYAMSSAASGARLVVVGSRGLGSIRRRLLGSVSQDLLHSAPCPVEVVHARHDKDGGRMRPGFLLFSTA